MPAGGPSRSGSRMVVLRLFEIWIISQSINLGTFYFRRMWERIVYLITSSL
jgi:hypothetical protein